MKIKHITTAVALSLIGSSAAFAADQWEHAIGTGLFGLNIKGDLGMTVRGQALEVDDAKLDSSQVRDFMDSAFGFGGYSKKGDWTIAYKYARLKLEDSQGSTLQNGVPVSGDVEFAASNAVVSGIYTFSRQGGHEWGALGGLRYASQELDVKVRVGGLTSKLTRDESWTDVIVGLTHATALGKTVVWHSQIDAGIGDGNSYHANTGLSWRFAPSWSADFFADYVHYDYENSSRNSANWYLYDAAEYGIGANLMYHF